MSEYIERGALRNKLLLVNMSDDVYSKGIQRGVEFAIDFLNEAPAADVVEVKHGRWVHDINNLYGCSECMERETMSPKKLKPYCPNCGADMRSKPNLQQSCNQLATNRKCDTCGKRKYGYLCDGCVHDPTATDKYEPEDGGADNG